MTYQIPLDNELIIDNFAGGGGASCGLEIALQRPVNIAINWDRGYPWDLNPWVWAITFKPIMANIDDVLAGRADA